MGWVKPRAVAASAIKGNWFLIGDFMFFGLLLCFWLLDFCWDWIRKNLCGPLSQKLSGGRRG